MKHLRAGSALAPGYAEGNSHDTKHSRVERASVELEILPAPELLLPRQLAREIPRDGREGRPLGVGIVINWE